MLAYSIATTRSTLAVQLVDPNVVLFGALLMALTAAFTLALLLRKLPTLWSGLAMMLGIILLLFAGILALDLTESGGKFYTFESARELSELLLTHRWLIIQLPIALLTAALGILLVYRDRLFEAHGYVYYLVVMFSVIISTGTVVVIGIESLI